MYFEENESIENLKLRIKQKCKPRGVIKSIFPINLHIHLTSRLFPKNTKKIKKKHSSKPKTEYTKVFFNDKEIFEEKEIQMKQKKKEDVLSDLGQV